jgi:hypothetical protein
MSTERRTILVSATFLWSIAVFALFAILVGAWLCLSKPSESFDQKRAQTRIERLKKLQQENQQKLEQYAWVDKQKGIAQLPITRAMELAMVELKGRKVQASSVKVENPYPTGLQQAPAPAPAPAASPAAAPEVKK